MGHRRSGAALPIWVSGKAVGRNVGGLEWLDQPDVFALVKFDFGETTFANLLPRYLQNRIEPQV